MEIITYKYIMDPNSGSLTMARGHSQCRDLELFHQPGLGMVTWFKQEIRPPEALEAQRRGVATEVVLDEIVRTIPPAPWGS
jgi:hypothetical protein